MGGTLLVVDDSQGMREYVGDALREAGYEVIEACDGIDALHCLNGTQPVRLVVTDLVMPNLDGFGLIETLRTTTAYRTTPVIVLTAEHDAECAERAKSCGADVSMTKPFSKRELVDTVGSLLGRAASA